MPRHVSLVDIFGRERSIDWRSLGDGLLEIRCDDLSPGIYLLSVRSPAGGLSSRVLLE